MAWAERLPSGRYRGVYRDGQKRQRSVGTYAHKARAEREAAAVEAGARRAAWSNPDAGKRPWGQWCADWWPTRQVEPGTLKVDESRRRVHLEPRWHDVPLAAITRHDIRAWAASMRQRGVGASTVQRAVHLLSASLAAAVDAEALGANPAARLRLEKGAQATERYLTRDEYDAIQAQMPSTADQLVMHVLTFTGLRWGEMAGLHRERVDFDGRVVTVAETWDERTGRIKAYPKGRTVRRVPLEPWLAELLAALPSTGTVCTVEHTSGRCRSGLLLTTGRGQVLRESNWYPVWREAVELAEVGHVRIHDMRHTYASWLIQAGVPLAKVGQLMGHRAPQTTARYAHLSDTPTDALSAALYAPPSVSSAPNVPHEPLAETGR